LTGPLKKEKESKIRWLTNATQQKTKRLRHKHRQRKGYHLFRFLLVFGPATLEAAFFFLFYPFFSFLLKLIGWGSLKAGRNRPSCFNQMEKKDKENAP